MRMIYRQWPVIAVVVVIIGAAVLTSFGDADVEDDWQRIDLAQLQALLRYSDRTAEYRLIPESVMTGLCWRNARGSREGLFKDVNAGMAYWRARAPSTLSDPGPVVMSELASSTDRGIDLARLSQVLYRLSFAATGYRYYVDVAEITGVLTIADTGRRVVLAVDLSEATSQHSREDLIELKAFTEIHPADFGGAFTTIIDQPLRLCIAMQAASEAVLPDPSLDLRVALSHYY